MKLSISLVVALLVLALSAFAQITIHNTDFAPVGSSWTTGSSDAGQSFNIGNAGPNQTWTFGNYTWTDVEQTSIVAPSSTPYAASFPTSNRAEQIFIPSFGTEYSFQQLTPTSLSTLGTATADTVIVFQNSMNTVSLPATYQSAWTSVNRASYTLEGITITTLDSVVQNVDAWGSVTTPYGTYPALRVFSHTWISMTVGGFPLTSLEFVSYTWVDQQGRMIVSVTAPEGQTSPNFSSGTVSMMGPALASDPVVAPVARSFEVGQNYPNPFNPTTTLPIALDKNARVALDVFDATGRLVSHSESDMPAGSHSLSIDGSRWATGNYFARVRAGSDLRTIKMQLVK